MYETKYILIKKITNMDKERNFKQKNLSIW